MNIERYFIIYKPVNMVCQFISSHKVNLLGNLNYDFPEGTHAIGRLDQHSEGLLLLTTNKKITKLLFQGEKPHVRTYLVQVKNKMTLETAKRLEQGIGGTSHAEPPMGIRKIQPIRRIAPPTGAKLRRRGQIEFPAPT